MNQNNNFSNWQSFLQKLSVNIFLILACLFAAEFILGIKEVNQQLKYGEHNPQQSKLISFLYGTKDLFYYNYIENSELYFKNKKFRQPSIGSEYKNEDIVLAGCSFAYGEEIKYEETFGVNLAKNLKKYKVYNIATDGASPKEMLYILRNYENYANLLPENPQNTKYFIYIFINDHKYRLVQTLHRSPKFKIKKDNQGNTSLEHFVPHKNFYIKTFLYKKISHYIQTRKLKNGKYQKALDDLSLLYMTEMKKEVDKIFPNAQFIFFIYDNEENIHIDTAALEQADIKVIDVNKLSNIDFCTEEYRTYDSLHPNGRAWTEITPLFIKAVKM